MTTDWAGCVSKLQESVELVAQQYDSFQVAAPHGLGFVQAEAGIQVDAIPLDADIQTAYNAGLDSVRASLASATGYRSLLDPVLLQFSRVMGKPQTDPLAVLPILYDYMALNQGGFTTAPRVQSRAFTRGAWSAAGGNTGTGTINRLTVDQYGFPLESGFAEVLSYQVLADAQSGTNPGQEQFAIFTKPYWDVLQRYQSGFGSGVGYPTGSLIGITGDNTQSLVLNPSFADGSGTNFTSGFTLNGWTINTPANVGLDTTAPGIYRACAIETTPAGLKVTGNVVLTQTLASRAGSLQQALAYYSQIACRFDAYGAATGSVQVQIGNLTYSLASGAASGGWNVLRPTQDKTNYFYNFNTANLTVTITITCSANAINIDDFLWCPYTQIGGTYFAAVGGATNWRYYDSGTTTDTISAEAGVGVLSTAVGEVQRAIAQAYGWSLPAIVAPTLTNSTLVAAAGTAVSVVTPGLHYFCFVDLGAAGESRRSTLVAYAADGTTKIDLSNIVAGPGGTTERNVYMTRATSPSVPTYGLVFYLAGVIAGNVTTTITINVADASLTTPVGLAQDPN